MLLKFNTVSEIMLDRQYWICRHMSRGSQMFFMTTFTSSLTVGLTLVRYFTRPSKYWDRTVSWVVPHALSQFCV